MSEAKTVAIIGAGPVGLAAGAHALENGLRPIILEAGPHVAHAVRQWPCTVREGFRVRNGWEQAHGGNGSWLLVFRS